MDPVQRATNAFARRFSGPAPRVFQAPGRVNLIGEHTDYNGGFVLPAALDRQVVVAARHRPDRRFRVYSTDFNQETSFSLDDIQRDTIAPWSNYVRGVAWSLQSSGQELTGMDATIAGNVPIGGGLSSSAAIEVATALALTKLAGIEIERLPLALAAQRAENDFVGMRCGIMDQFVACFGQAGHAIFIDCRDLTYRAVPLGDQADIVVVDSRVQRGLRDSEYNARRAECEAAARHFGVPTLRDIGEDIFAKRANELPFSTQRRARHVVTEIARTAAASTALEDGDLATFGRLMYASHASMRDDFEASCPELDQLVEIAASVPGVYGARLTGAGFGGCIVALVQPSAIGRLRQAIEKQYFARSGRTANVYHCRASAGASELV